jgi:hypothetical protein
VEAAEILFLKEKRIATKSRTMANIILNYFWYKKSILKK